MTVHECTCTRYTTRLLGTSRALQVTAEHCKSPSRRRSEKVPFFTPSFGARIAEEERKRATKKMPGIDFLRLEDARDDSPQARSMLGLFEEDTALYTEYVTGLQAVCRHVVECENALSGALQTLSKKLQEYEMLRFPLGRDDSILASTLKQFGKTIEEVSSVHTAHSTQLNDLMVQPLTSFTNGELTEVTNMKELNRMLEQEHEAAIVKYCRVSKKKENETKARIDANDELYTCRKKMLQNSLHYYNALNFFQYKRTSNLLSPMLGFFRAQLFFFRLGKETISKQTEDYLSHITESLQSVHAEMGQLAQRSSDKTQEIMEGSTYYFMPEPTPDMQMQTRPIKTNLSQMAGHLMTRSKSGLGHRWDRQYFFTQGGNLMSNAKGQIAGSLVIDLDGCTVNAAEVDDRRFVFQVTRPEDTKRLVSLQCMSESDRAEWITTIRSISSGFYMREKSPQMDVPFSSAAGDARSRALGGPLAGGAFAGLSPQGTGGNSLASPTGGGGGGTRPKQPASLPNIPQKQSGQRRSRSGSGSQEPSDTPPPSPLDSLLSSTPIQFDMITPSEEQAPALPVGHAFRQAMPTKEGPQRRVNPFGEPAAETRPAQVGGPVAGDDSITHVQTFRLRFLGSMEVRWDKGLDVVMDTIRKIMAARAIHDIFKMTELNLVISSQSLRLLDTVKQTVRAHHELTDISFWAAHQENKRLFAFITRRQGTRYQPQFVCHVFESDVCAEEVCRAISMAADIAFQVLQQQGLLLQQQGVLQPTMGHQMQEDDQKAAVDIHSPPTQFGKPPYHTRSAHWQQQTTPPAYHQRPQTVTDQGGGYIQVRTMPSADRPIGPATGPPTGQPTGLVTGPLTGSSAGLASGPTSGLVSGPPTGLVTGPPTGLVTGPPTGLVTGPTSGLVTGPTTGLVTGPPTGLVSGPPTGLVTNPPTGLVTGPTSSMVTGPSTVLATGPPTGLVTGPSNGLVTSLPTGLSTDLAPGQPTTSPPFNANENNNLHWEARNDPRGHLASGLGDLNLNQNEAREKFEGHLALDESDA